jgi:hypothetical protein
MKICSWDVGIKNLAFCVLEKTTDNKIRIIKWDKINIIDSDKIICCALSQKSSNKIKDQHVCGKIASFYYTDKYYCGSHKTTHKPFNNDYNLWESNNVINSSNKEKCSFSYKKDCCKMSTLSIYNKNYCVSHAKIIINRIKKENELKPIKKQKISSSFSPMIITHKLYTKMNAIPELFDVDEILIENQPSLKNPTMKTIASLLFGHCVNTGVILTNRVTNVKFFSPSNKLKVDMDYINKILAQIDEHNRIFSIIIKLLTKYCSIDIPFGKKHVEFVLKYLMDKNCILDPSTNIEFVSDSLLINTDKLHFQDIFNNLKKIEKDNSNYEITKLLSIKYVEILLTDQNIIINNTNNTNDWISFLNSFKKKDDLCDALIQAYYYLK